MQNRRLKMWDHPKALSKASRKPLHEQELYDASGGKTLKSIFVWMIYSNSALSSNQGLKKNTFKMLDVVELSGALKPKALLASLFWYSMPDLSSDLELVLEKKRYDKIPTTAAAFLFNALLMPFHVVAEALQILLQLTSLPTQLTLCALKQATNPEHTRGKSLAYGSLVFLIALFTAAFQATSVLANTIAYARHLVDSLLVLTKMLVQTGLNGLTTLFASSCHDLEFDTWLEEIDPSFKKLDYVIRDFTDHACKLMPLTTIWLLGTHTGFFPMVSNQILALLDPMDPELLVLLCLRLWEELFISVWLVQLAAFIRIMAYEVCSDYKALKKELCLESTTHVPELEEITSLNTEPELPEEKKAGSQNVWNFYSSKRPSIRSSSASEEQGIELNTLSFKH